MSPETLAVIVGAVVIIGILWIWAPVFFRRKPKPHSLHEQELTGVAPQKTEWWSGKSFERYPLDPEEEAIVDQAVSEVMRQRRLPKTWTEYLADRRADPKRRG